MEQVVRGRVRVHGKARRRQAPGGGQEEMGREKEGTGRKKEGLDNQSEQILRAKFTADSIVLKRSGVRVRGVHAHTQRAHHRVQAHS